MQVSIIKFPRVGRLLNLKKQVFCLHSKYKLKILIERDVSRKVSLFLEISMEVILKIIFFYFVEAKYFCVIDSPN